MPQLKELYRDLNTLLEERAAATDTRHGISLSNIMAHTGAHGSPVERAAIRLAQIETKIRKKQAEIEEKKADILLMIDALADTELRVLYYYPDYRGMTWDEIERITDEDRDTLRIRYKRSLTKQKQAAGSTV